MLLIVHSTSSITVLVPHVLCVSHAVYIKCQLCVRRTFQKKGRVMNSLPDRHDARITTKYSLYALVART